MKHETQAYLWGLLGVGAFGLTLPATKAAVPLFGFVTVGLGRAVIAGILGLVLLMATRSKIPTQPQLFRLAIVALGVVFGFPFFSAYAMESVPASHGAIITGLIPLFTALLGVLLAKEKPSLGYWVAGLVGSGTIVSYSIYIGGGVLQIADAALLLAVMSAAIGYAEGARLAKELGSWRVICYALVISLPVTLPITLLGAEINLEYNALPAWIGFFYLSIISMFLGFFAWYKGLQMGGIAKVGQLQLLQPFVTFFASSVLFREQISSLMFLVLAIVLTSVHFGRKSKVIRE
ncbi:MAG: DMT family transporter [Leptolyngbyaceae cyanobacterium CSU_1_4]|nr:DMT family transporter [Leptolyngbyaceae cyanobacterium CSU_1_4]